MSVKKVCSEYEGAWSNAQHRTVCTKIIRIIDIYHHYHRNVHVETIALRAPIATYSKRLHTLTCEKLLPNWSNKVLTRSYAVACVRVHVNERFFCVGSDTDTVIHTKLNSVKSEAYLIKSCGKFSVEFVSYFRTFRSSVHFIPCVLTFKSSLGMFVGLLTFVVCHFLCVKTQAQRKTYNSSMWLTFMRIKWTERKTFFPTISSE